MSARAARRGSRRCWRTATTRRRSLQQISRCSTSWWTNSKSFWIRDPRNVTRSRPGTACREQRGAQAEFEALTVATGNDQVTAAALEGMHDAEAIAEYVGSGSSPASRSRRCGFAALRNDCSYSTSTRQRRVRITMQSQTQARLSSSPPIRSPEARSPSTANAKDGTIDVVWYSGRAGPEEGPLHRRTLHAQARHGGCRIDRLNSGAPVFDTHFTGDDFKS